MSSPIIVALLLGLAALSADAQNSTNIAAASSSAYNQDNEGNVARSQYGLCWRTGYWTPNNSISGCDGELAPPITNPIAPPLVQNPAAVNTTSVAPTATASVACNFTVVLGGNQTFGSGQTRLNRKAQDTINREVIQKLNECKQIGRIVITGHADSSGSPKHNREISLKRAEEVATFLKSKNVGSDIHTVGAGSSEPIAKCGPHLPARKLASCLSPERRVVISVQGHEK